MLAFYDSDVTERTKSLVDAITITQSKMFSGSLKYYLKPYAVSFISISKMKMKENVALI